MVVVDIVMEMVNVDLHVILINSRIAMVLVKIKEGKENPVVQMNIVKTINVVN